MRHVQIPHHVTRSNLKASDIGIYVLLRSFRNNKDARCMPSKNTIAALAGCSESTVRWSLNRLRDAKVLSWKSGRKGRSNEYIFNDIPSLLPPSTSSHASQIPSPVTNQLYGSNNMNKLRKSNNSKNDFCLTCHIEPCRCN